MRVLDRVVVAVLASTTVFCAHSLRVGLPSSRVPPTRTTTRHVTVHVESRLLTRRLATEADAEPPATADDLLASTTSATSTPLDGEEDRNARLRRDIERFKSSRGDDVSPVSKNAGPLASVVNVLGAILSVNFVVIVALFLWFLWGCFSLGVLDNDAVILAVKAAFDPYILPILSTHMALTFLSAGLERVAGIGED